MRDPTYYFITFIYAYGEKKRYFINEDEHVIENEDALNQEVWARWCDKISDDSVTTFVHDARRGFVECGWVWVAQLGRLVRVF